MSRARDLADNADKVITDFGGTLVDDADASTARTTLGLGTMAVATATDYASLSGATFTGDVSGTNLTLSGYLRAPASFTIDPATHGDATGTVVVAGNLQVDGDTTTINSTTLTVDDKTVVLASGASDSANANGAGISIDGAGATMLYTHATGSWDFNKPVNVTGDVTINHGSGATTGVLTLGNANGNGTLAQINMGHSGDPDHGNISYTGSMVFKTGANATALTLDGSQDATFAGDVALADNKKATFGGGDDLQIYYDGSDAYIRNHSGGKIIQRARTGLLLQTNATDGGADDAITANQSGSVELTYANVKKFETTNTGVTVTGITTSTGFSGKIHPVNGTTTNYLSLKDTNELNFYNASDASQTLHINYDGGDVNLAQNALELTSAGGAIFQKVVQIQGSNLTTNLVLRGRSTDNNFYTQYKSHNGSAVTASFGTDASNDTFNYQADNHAFQNLASNITYMKIDSSGNTLVGSTSNLSSAKLYVKGTKSGTGGNAGQLVVLDDTAYSTSDNGGAIQFAGNFYDGGQVVFATVQGVKSNNTDANSAGDLIFTTKAHGGNQTERMRIDSSGHVLHNTGSWSSSSGGLLIEKSGNLSQLNFSRQSGDTGSHNVLLSYHNGSYIGGINTSTSATSFITSSDYRLKENVVTDWDATSRLKQLKPSRFNFKIDKDTIVDGFLAHEVSSIVPEAVTGTKDEVDEDGNAVMQGIDQSKLVPLLVKTIQELEARIATLEGA
jgi:hypothetical protein